MTRHSGREGIIAHGAAHGAGRGMQEAGEGAVGGDAAAGDLQEGEEDALAGGGEVGGVD